MRKIKISSPDEKVEGYPYQLTHWILEKELTSVIEPFKRYKEEDDGIVVELGIDKTNPARFAVFTKGLNIAKANTYKYEKD